MQLISLIVEMLYISLIDNKIFIKEKRAKPSLLSLNIAWFTSCGWAEQLNAFDQLYCYKTNKI
jgi:hypothetical protein